MSNIKLEEFANGALQEKFQDAMEKVLENLMDPNTPWKTKRKIQMEITITQNEDRDNTSVNVSVNTKLAPVKPIETMMAIGKDLKTGKVFCQEYGKQVRGQMSLDDFPEGIVVIDNKTVDTETGEIIEGKVVDMKQKKA